MMPAASVPGFYLGHPDATYRGHRAAVKAVGISALVGTPLGRVSV